MVYHFKDSPLRELCKLKSIYNLEQFLGHDGQSDTIDASIPEGAFVFPAMSVATIGRGSSEAGHEYLNSLVPETAGNFETFPVKLARDEHVFLPDQVSTIGDGDLERGAKILEDWVQSLINEPVGYKIDDNKE